jgi:FlaA1/EpsC-like NDP-sugar epimerase
MKLHTMNGNHSHDQKPPRSFDGKRILITGGTGSLGKTLVRRFLRGTAGHPAKLIVLSRDEAKQHAMRMEYQNRSAATDEIIYRNFQELLEFRIGDVRDYHSVTQALRDVDMVFNAAALKQVPTCEYFPYEAVRTNIEGPENIVRAIQEHRLPIETVVGVSTDKACKPVNAMGMTKALQERVFIQANIRCPDTRFVCVRYGNVLASRGSVIPLFHDQIRNGGPVTITTPEMTRFLLSLNDAVDVIFAAVETGAAGETYIPRVPSALVMHIATALVGARPIQSRIVGIRPGEKVHETLVSDEEAHRTVERGGYYAILPMLPELRRRESASITLAKEYSSADDVMTLEETTRLLHNERLMPEHVAPDLAEVLR